MFSLAKVRAITPEIMPVTATSDSHYCTCLGPLGRRDTDRIISIGKGKYIRRNITGIIVRDIALYFANVNDPLKTFPKKALTSN